MRVAIVGIGEVGRCYATGLADLGGHKLLLCDPLPAPQSRALAAARGLALEEAPGAWLAEVDLVLACVQGGHALAALKGVLPYLKPGTEYADLSTAEPEIMRMAADVAEAAGIQFMDIAIMGGIPMTAHRTPLLCAGPGGEKVRRLCTDLGAPLRLLPKAQPGDAVTLKLLRSIFTKGMEALAVECLRAAEVQGVREELLELLSDIDKAPIRELLDAMLRTHVLHAERRMHEVEAAGGQLERLGLPLIVQPGVRTLFENTAKAVAARGLPGEQPSFEQALAWLLEDLRPPSDGATGERPARLV